mmetsp:Transcript_13204/g.50565  ORF Transcript_13204/g.50565 Transcript_13204/m.50565 type:complete len:207 (-) Transcript_13204:2078-2698(-)
MSWRWRERALVREAVDSSTFVTCLDLSSVFSVSMSGYAKRPGRQRQSRAKEEGRRNSPGLSLTGTTATTEVGWVARERQWARGNQYQYWVKRAMPMTAVGLVNPDGVVRDTTQLRPPASRMPAAMMAPMRAMAGLKGLEASAMTRSRNFFTMGVRASLSCWRTMAVAMKAPWRTKSTGSSRRGWRMCRAEGMPVAAAAMPRDIAAP